jgi:hypothetical protein
VCTGIQCPDDPVGRERLRVECIRWQRTRLSTDTAINAYTIDLDHSPSGYLGWLLRPYQGDSLRLGAHPAFAAKPIKRTSVLVTECDQ